MASVLSNDVAILAVIIDYYSGGRYVVKTEDKAYQDLRSDHGEGPISEGDVIIVWKTKDGAVGEDTLSLEVFMEEMKSDLAPGKAPESSVWKETLEVLEEEWERKAEKLNDLENQEDNMPLTVAEQGHKRFLGICIAWLNDEIKDARNKL